jgi:hypothetical protein
MFTPLIALVLFLPLQISSVAPSEGANGTTLLLDGAGFGAKPAAVRLLDAATGKRVPLKLVTWSDTHVEAQLRKSAPAGLRDVELLRKPKGLAPLVASAAFTVRAPAPQSVAPAVTVAKSQVTLTGQFFGAKKGKLRVGGLPAKVLAWSDTSISFVVPKAAAGGVRDVSVLNGSGQGTLASALVVQGAVVPGGKGHVAVVVDGALLQADGSWRAFGLQGAALQLGASFDGARSLEISLPVDLGTSPLPVTVIDDPAGFVAFREGAPLVDGDATAWTTQGQGDVYRVDLVAAGSGIVVGSVTATLQRVSGAGAPATLTLSSGSFVLLLPGAP